MLSSGPKINQYQRARDSVHNTSRDRIHPISCFRHRRARKGQKTIEPDLVFLRERRDKRRYTRGQCFHQLQRSRIIACGLTKASRDRAAYLLTFGAARACARAAKLGEHAAMLAVAICCILVLLLVFIVLIIVVGQNVEVKGGS